MSVGPAHAYASFLNFVLLLPAVVHLLLLSLKTYFPGMGLACLKVLPEGSFAFPHINSISGGFYFLIVLCTVEATSWGELFYGPWKKLCPVCPSGDMTDYRWLFLCPPFFLDGSYKQSLLEELLQHAWC